MSCFPHQHIIIAVIWKLIISGCFSGNKRKGKMHATYRRSILNPFSTTNQNWFNVYPIYTALCIHEHQGLTKQKQPELQVRPFQHRVTTVLIFGLKQLPWVKHFTPTDRFSLIQNNDWKSPLKLLSVERVKPMTKMLYQGYTYLVQNSMNIDGMGCPGAGVVIVYS